VSGAAHPANPGAVPVDSDTVPLAKSVPAVRLRGTDLVDIPVASSAHLSATSPWDVDTSKMGDGWWESTMLMFKHASARGDKDALQHLKEALLADISGWNFVSALVLVLCTASLLVTEDTFLDSNPWNFVIRYVFVIAFMLGACCAILSVLIANMCYVCTLTVPPELICFWLVSHFSIRRSYRGYADWAGRAVNSVMLGLCAGVYLLHGLPCACISIAIALGALWIYRLAGPFHGGARYSVVALSPSFRVNSKE